MITLKAHPLTAAAFAPFGDVIATDQVTPIMINQGYCARHSDLAKLNSGDGRMGISLFQAQLRNLPYRLDLLERHPKGSQCFIPMCQNGFLIIVAPDKNDTPDTPLAFISQAGQAINIHANIWHGVLTPLKGSGLFAVIDRIPTHDNLQEYPLNTTYLVS